MFTAALIAVLVLVALIEAVSIGPAVPGAPRPYWVEPTIVNGCGGISLPWPGGQRLRLLFGRWAAPAMRRWMDRRYPPQQFNGR